jgi:hypothetical protein
MLTLIAFKENEKGSSVTRDYLLGIEARARDTRRCCGRYSKVPHGIGKYLEFAIPAVSRTGHDMAEALLNIALRTSGGRSINQASKPIAWGLSQLAMYAGKSIAPGSASQIDVLAYRLAGLIRFRIGSRRRIRPETENPCCFFAT